MSREDLVAVATRLFSIFLVVLAIRFAFGAVSFNQFSDLSTMSLAATGSITICTLSIAVLLWYFPVTIARKLLPVMRDSGPALSASPHQVQEVAFSILGFWVLASAVSDATYWVSLAVFTIGSVTPGIEFDPSTKGAMLATALDIAIGFALLLGARGIVGAIHRLRYGGSSADRSG